MKKLHAFTASAVILSALAGSFTMSAYASNTDSQFNNLVRQGVPGDALKAALKGYQWAVNKGQVHNRRYLTVVDFNLPSTSKRMWVIDLSRGQVVYNELVSHGAGSGGGNMATRFSDSSGSHASVLGVMVTASTYSGKHGRSLTLDGLQNINYKVRSRTIVVHPAEYATPSYARSRGYLGHSWGCFAIDPHVSNQVISTIKDGSVLFAYSRSYSYS